MNTTQTETPTTKESLFEIVEHFYALESLLKKAVYAVISNDQMAERVKGSVMRTALVGPLVLSVGHYSR